MVNLFPLVSDSKTAAISDNSPKDCPIFNYQVNAGWQMIGKFYVRVSRSTNWIRMCTADVLTVLFVVIPFTGVPIAVN